MPYMTERRTDEKRRSPIFANPPPQAADVAASVDPLDRPLRLADWVFTAIVICILLFFAVFEVTISALIVALISN